MDPGLRALLDDLARLDGRAPLPGAGAVEGPGGCSPTGGGLSADVTVLPSGRPSSGAGPGWAEVVDLAAYRQRSTSRDRRARSGRAGEAGEGSADPAS